MLRHIIGYSLIIMGMFQLLSGAIYALGPNPEYWWSRFALGLVLLGLYYAGSKEGE